jgi:serine/threonine protein kinase
MLKDTEEATSFCGTPEYLAPEMVMQQGHDKAVDWWAIGVLMYEMLIGVTPFFNKNKNMLLTKIKNSKVIFPDRKKYKIDYSDEMMDIIGKLLDKDKSTRLGSKGDAQEILSHPFFKDLNIQDVMEEKMEPPFKPKIENEADFEKYFNVETDKSALKNTYIPKINRQQVQENQDVFQAFD